MIGSEWIRKWRANSKKALRARLGDKEGLIYTLESDLELVRKNYEELSDSTGSLRQEKEDLRARCKAYRATIDALRIKPDQSIRGLLTGFLKDMRMDLHLELDSNGMIVGGGGRSLRKHLGYDPDDLFESPISKLLYPSDQVVFRGGLEELGGDNPIEGFDVGVGLRYNGDEDIYSNHNLRVNAVRGRSGKVSQIRIEGRRKQAGLRSTNKLVVPVAEIIGDFETHMGNVRNGYALVIDVRSLRDVDEEVLEKLRSLLTYSNEENVYSRESVLITGIGSDIVYTSLRGIDSPMIRNQIGIKDFSHHYGNSAEGAFEPEFA